MFPCLSSSQRIWDVVRFSFASPRRSWRTSGTLLGCCQASPKCLSVLLGRVSAALGSPLRHSGSLLSSSCLPYSASISFFPIWGRFFNRFDNQNPSAAPRNSKKRHRSPLLRGKLAEPKVTGRMLSHISFSLFSLSLICHLSALFCTPEETKQPRQKKLSQLSLLSY